MCKLFLNQTKKNLFLFLLIFLTIAADAKVEDEISRKHYSICANGIHTFFEVSGSWILMKGVGTNWELSTCNQYDNSKKIFDLGIEVEVIAENIKIKKVNSHEIWVFVPKTK